MEDISVLQKRLLEFILLNSNSNVSTENIEHHQEESKIISEEHELIENDLYLHQM
jgi:hypothetical protein